MTVEVALAMLQRDGRWLMQLRDEIPSIAPQAAGVCSVAIGIPASRRSRPSGVSCWRKSAGSPMS